MEFTESENQLISSTVGNLQYLIQDMGIAKFSGNKEEEIKAFIFARTVALNLVCNLVLQCTDLRNPTALERNFNLLIEDIKNFVKTAKTINFKKDTH